MSRQYSKITGYVIGLGVAGAVALSAAAVLGAMGPVDPMIGVTLTIAMGVSIWAPLRFIRRGETQGFTIDEGVLIAMLFTLPGGLVPLLHTLATAGAHVARRTEPVKVLFNTGHVAIGSVLATATFHAIGMGSSVFAPRSLLAAVAATVVYDLVDTAMLAELFRRLIGRSWRETIAQVRHLYAITSLGNVGSGLLLAVVARAEPAGLIVAVAVLVGLYLGYRGYAGMLEERERTSRLHSVTGTLAGAVGSEETLGLFLERAVELFGAEAAELAYVGPGVNERLVWRKGELERLPADPDDPLVTEVLRSGRARYVAATTTERELRQELSRREHRDALVAPLVHEGRSLGMLAIYDRHGLEPWDETDATFLGSLAHEAAIAVRNAELFASLRREKAKLAEETQKLRDVIGSASDGICYVDATGLVQTWNAGMVDATGITEEEACGRPWFMALRVRDEYQGEFAIEGDSPVRRALSGVPAPGPVDVEVLRRDGEWRWLRCSFSPVIRAGQEVVGVVMVARDVTRERETDELKADFVATISHELRTPITPLKGWLDTALESGRDFSADELEVMFTSMRRQTNRLERLLSDLLLVADMNRGAVDARFRPVPLATLLEEVVGAERSSSTLDRITVECPDGLRALADPRAVTRIVRAFVDNALKHTDGPIVVSASPRDAEAAIAVKDKGRGIAPGDQDRIFERFTRLGDHLTRSTQGSGLGLFIARGLAERTGGRIELDSTLGEGSVFRLVLPGVDAPSPTAPTRLVPEHGEQPVTE